MAEVDYKSLFNQAKVFISSKYDYSKLTLAEKLSILLVQIAFFAIALLIGFSILMFLSFALVFIVQPPFRIRDHRRRGTTDS